MFGRYDGDWDDEETKRTYLLADRKIFNAEEFPIREEVECVPADVKHSVNRFRNIHRLDVVYVLELVEQAQWVPNITDSGVAWSTWMYLEDIQ